MTSLTLLRRLVLQQQFELLYESCSTPQTADEQVLLAMACAHLGDLPAARRCLDALDKPALDIDARVDLAAVHLVLDEADTAYTLLQAAREEVPDHALLLARLAICCLRQQQTDAARELCARSVALQPTILTYELLLRLTIQDGDLLQAETTLQEAEMFWLAECEQWPEQQAALHSQHLRGLRLEWWLAAGQLAAADAWLDEQQPLLAEDDYTGLLIGYAQRLAERSLHAQAEEVLRRGLRAYPEHLGLLRSLAGLAEVQGRNRQAIALLRRALRLAEQRGRQVLPIQLQLVTLANNAHLPVALELAQQAVNKTQALRPGIDGDVKEITVWQAQAQTALAIAEVHAQRFDEAEARFSDVLQTHPQLISALQGLGQLCLQLGRIDEAVSLFEQVKQLEPVRGYAALISARQFPEDEATLEKLEALARRPGLEGPVHTGLLLQLASAWEKRKAYAKAFSLADEANAASRALLNYDPVAHRQRCARIRHAFSRSLYQHRQGLGNPSALPVFVVGMPRSGTTLVEQILSGHSDIHGAGELGLIPGVIAGLDRWERHTGSGRQYPDCVDDLSAKVVAGITNNLLNELQDYAPEARHVIDKLPHNFENIGLIKLLFPNARIISVRRDPRDIALSNYFTDYAAKHGGMGFAYDLRWIGEQLADHNLLLHHWNQVFPGEILEVQYEALLANPEHEARRMLDYIGVAWEPQVLEFSELQRPVKTASVWQVRQPLYQTSKAKWLHYQDYLAPLIAGTNARIEWQPITDMAALPVAGLLEAAVQFYTEEKLDEAEHHCQQLLHHVPDHAAAQFLLGLIFLHKGYMTDAIALMGQAQQRCPWNANWRRDLSRAYELAGETDKAAALKTPHRHDDPLTDVDANPAGEFAWT